MEECGRLTQTVEKLNNEIHNHLKTIDERDAEIRENEAIRRKLHNEVQELKGNIRVYCRVRPLLKGEDNQDCDLPITFDSNCDKNIQIHHSNTNDDGCRRTTSEKYDFTFDKVFNPTSAQEDIFLEISQLVQSALDGYNVCIFAYGQTGSGKTYTMEGCVDHNSGSNNARAGMIPRTVNQIFTSASALSSKGWKYDIEASFLEIYNETVRDLLEDNHKKKENIKYEIKLTKSSNGVNHVAVTNAKIVKVESERQVYDLLKVASRHRATAATKCNEYSSRSHSVFRLNLIGSNSLTGQNCEGTLNLVDLAGSERINVSGATGDRLNEAKNINKSLSTLSKVILSLANKDSHIPYRNSKLTYLLQNSLGGNSKTLMFVNISPSIHCFHESLSSLRFATKVS
ncbi:uncharacterized protein TRIADDRAFT_28174 [Trichoplax adhaerens]|uniref:Kinesin-like protein n=1 Tax=Trichoplax adhaerens TaxID=10228 RepID=B3S3J2_TRIAD|nr:hypothetical protein TRIADDRAFT_28174 [Trichoplax adhaerens]EDV22804.1 hypothetical protein TRIADDRAFT_28174 [Trichoplax adhaerens]|eukprot:XP_002114670.1 hypothetical protein TRIADDRAFT_28174 [Trichoplax adhaerens]